MELHSSHSKTPILISALLVGFSMCAGLAPAQTVRVDATPSHVVNTFSPLRALGATVDRIPTNTTEVFFRPDQVQRVLEAGLGPISYRLNTELFVQAWHWNPNGTWSDPSGKGYFVGDAKPTEEMIRHSYGYSLPHRGVTQNWGSEFDGFSRLNDGVGFLAFFLGSLMPTAGLRSDLRLQAAFDQFSAIAADLNRGG